MTSLGFSSTSDVITFDQIWHHLCSTSAEEEDLSSDAQIGVIVRMEPEICSKMLKKRSEKLRPKFAATTPGCSMVKIACLDDAFLEVFLTASKHSRRSIPAANRKEKEKKERPKKIPKIEKPKDIDHKILISAHARLKMAQIAMLVARKPSCRDANAFLTRLKLI